MNDQETHNSNPAVIDVQQHDDDRHSVSSEDRLLSQVDSKSPVTSVPRKDPSENNTGIDNESNANTESKKQWESQGKSPEVNAKTEKQEVGLDGRQDEVDSALQRKGSKSGFKMKKKKNSVEDITFASVEDDKVQTETKASNLKIQEVMTENKVDGKQDTVIDIQGNNAENKNIEKTNGNEKANLKKVDEEKDNPAIVITGANKTDKSLDEIAVEGSDDLGGYTKVTGKEDLDALSTLSFKEQKDFKYYFQHPYVRLFIAYFVTFCNFLIYAEDPVAHSRKESNIPLVGNDFSFVIMQYPSNAWSLLKVVLWLSAIVVGMIVGKLVVHKLLFCKVFRLQMFTDDKGSWMIMFLFTLLSLFIFSWIYNAFLLAGGSSTEEYRISGSMGLTNSIFMKMAATGTWCGDFFTAWMVTDMMLQEKLYPYWARPVRRWWNKRFNRIILFWTVTSLASFAVLFTIATDYIQWDKLHRDFLSSNEVSRAFLASFILVMDILIVVQDWDFPHFIGAIDIKLPGVNTAHIKFDIPKCFRPEKWQIHITGKWFNYGILFMVMILDLNMWKNQIFYDPYAYGQYVGPDGKIHTVKDDYSLENHNETLLSFSYRNSTINPLTNQTYISGDGVMNSRFYNQSLAVKGIAFIPALIAFITFGVLVWHFGRFIPSKADPYAGRLLKRPKKKSSFRLFRENMGKRFSLRKRVKAVPKLIGFTRRTTNKQSSDYPENDRPPTDPQ